MQSISLEQSNLNPHCTFHSLELQASLDADAAAVHEFRIPTKALLGLHSYCPVHFDIFHAVLVDLSIHIAFLKAGTAAPPQKVSRFVTGSVSKVDACLEEMFMYTYNFIFALVDIFSKSQIATSIAGDHFEGPNQVSIV